MKNTIFTIFTIFLLASCSKNEDPIPQENPLSKLPPETQTGANTFGVTINGKVYIPRDPIGYSTNPSVKGMSYWGSPDNVSWNELKIKDGASAVGFNMIIHIQNLQSLGVNKY